MVARSLTALAKVIGADGVEKLTAAFGGLHLYVPPARLIGEDHRLAKLLGLPGAIALASAVCATKGLRIYVPIDSAKRTKIMLAAGSNSEIARQFGCSERHVAKCRRGIAKTGRPGRRPKEQR